MRFGLSQPLRLLAPVLLVVLAGGCGGRGSNPTGDGSSALADAAEEPGEETTDAGELPESDTGLLDGMVSCVMDPRVDTYTAGLTKMGAKSMAQVKVMTADPAPPAKGGNAWTIQLLDAAGNPLDGTFTVDEKMPDHGHGSAVRPKITKGDAVGSYTLNPLYLFMAGVWRIQFTVFPPGADGGAPLDTVTFFFCVEG
jgi:YtkA-like